MDDLYSVELVEGLPVRNPSNGNIVHYKRVLLREATFQHHQNAMRSVQELRRCADDGVYRLVHNQEALDAARMVQQIDRFTGAGAEIFGSDIDDRAIFASLENAKRAKVKVSFEEKDINELVVRIKNFKSFKINF